VVEEILRIYGYNTIPMPRWLKSSLSFTKGVDSISLENRVAESLIAQGFFEVSANSIVSSKYEQSSVLVNETVLLLNSQTAELDALRTSMIYGLLDIANRNINHKSPNVKLFEFGKVYWRETEKLQSENSRFQEEERLAIYLSGNYEAENWQNKSKATSYYDVAQFVSNILEKCTIRNAKQENLENHPLLEYGIRLSQGKTELGIVGKVKPSLAKELGVKQEVFYADLNTTMLFRSASPKFRVEEISKFPEVRRDLSLVLDKSVSFAEIKNLIQETEKKFLKDIIVFDVYEGDKIPEGKKAYALGFTLLDGAKTLTDEEIDKTMTKLIAAFESKFEAVIRK
jgi:phenylalanyl-tRNA synthetase beta chain